MVSYKIKTKYDFKGLDRKRKKEAKEQMRGFLKDMEYSLEKAVSSANDHIKQYVSGEADGLSPLSNILTYTDPVESSAKSEYNPKEHYKLVALKKQTSERQIYTNNVAIASYTEAAIKASQANKPDVALVASAKVDSLEKQNDNLQRMVMHEDMILTGIKIRMETDRMLKGKCTITELNEKIYEMQEQAEPTSGYTEKDEALEELINQQVADEMFEQSLRGTYQLPNEIQQNAETKLSEILNKHDAQTQQVAKGQRRLDVFKNKLREYESEERDDD